MDGALRTSEFCIKEEQLETGQVAVQLKSLSRQVREVQELIGILQDKLSPIIFNEPEPVSPEETKPDIICSVAEYIRDNSNSIREATARIQKIINGIQL